jgi:CheY-like chemotaxis protein
MTQRVFVKVIGFTDVERHALNTVFRLSEQRETAYALWDADAPEPARLALIDGQSDEHRTVQPFSYAGMKLIWVGAIAPAQADRVFERPLSWPEVLQAMDDLFVQPPPLDFDLDLDDNIDSEMGDTRPPDESRPRRALIACADRDERLYLRARLALADLSHVDEAETGAQALELAWGQEYAVALVDFSMPDIEGWAFLKELTRGGPGIAQVIVTKQGASLPERLRAWVGGAHGFLDKPPHPAKLQSLLQRV